MIPSPEASFLERLPAAIVWSMIGLITAGVFLSPIVFALGMFYRLFRP